MGSLWPLDPATGAAFLGNTNATSIVENWLQRGPYRTEAELLAFRYKALAFFTRQFGITFAEPLPPLDVPIPVQVCASPSRLPFSDTHRYRVY